MRKALGILATLALAGAASAAAQDTIDPVGVWEWEVDFQGQIVAGTFEISGETDNWTGSAQSDMGPADITSITVDANVLTLTVMAPDGSGEVVIEMVVEGDEFSGVGTIGYDEFVITGRRRAG